MHLKVVVVALQNRNQNNENKNTVFNRFAATPLSHIKKQTSFNLSHYRPLHSVVSECGNGHTGISCLMMTMTWDNSVNFHFAHMDESETGVLYLHGVSGHRLHAVDSQTCCHSYQGPTETWSRPALSCILVFRYIHIHPIWIIICNKNPKQRLINWTVSERYCLPSICSVVWWRNKRLEGKLWKRIL